jgi:hypothetical protein
MERYILSDVKTKIYTCICMYVCMYVRMYVCMYVNIYKYIWRSIITRACGTLSKNSLHHGEVIPKSPKKNNRGSGAHTFTTLFPPLSPGDRQGGNNTREQRPGVYWCLLPVRFQRWPVFSKNFSENNIPGRECVCCLLVLNSITYTAVDTVFPYNF